MLLTANWEATVDPEKVKRQKAIRDAKVKKREEKQRKKEGRAIIRPAQPDP